VLDFGADDGSTALGTGVAEWIFHGVKGGGLGWLPATQQGAPGGQPANFAEQPQPLGRSPAKRQAQALATDDYAEGHIGHAKIDTGLSEYAN
jgi:hypothetical protein